MTISRSWSAASQKALSTADPLLKELADRVLKSHSLDIRCTCGHRSKDEQDAAVARKASYTPWPKSKHNKTPSHAIDLAVLLNGQITWEVVRYRELAVTAKRCWAEMVADGSVPDGVTMHWGGDFKSFFDGPHFELRGGAYSP